MIFLRIILIIITFRKEILSFKVFFFIIKLLYFVSSEVIMVATGEELYQNCVKILYRVIH